MTTKNKKTKTSTTKVVRERNTAIARKGGAMVDKALIANMMAYAVQDMLDGLSAGFPFDFDGMEAQFMQYMNGLK